MEDLKPDSTPPDFSSLTGIMARFREIPYEQFQQELQAWFELEMKMQGRDCNDQTTHGILNLSDLISRIYHQAEVLQILSDNQITPDHDRS